MPMHAIQSKELKNFHMTLYSQQKEMQVTSRKSCHLLLYPISEQSCGDIIYDDVT